MDLVDLANLWVDFVDCGGGFGWILWIWGADSGVDLMDLADLGVGFRGFGGGFRQERYCQERWLRLWNVCIHECLHIHSVYIYIYIYAQTSLYIHIFIYIYIYIYIHMYMQK